ncbi:hypothetical protein ACQP26_29280 [Micromonospora sp. CA-248089]|uniref:hypothetical protein n=1 Tax=Micromonospora sp. CA-248089 TaxID=3239960 RepID=UPI003D93677D
MHLTDSEGRILNANYTVEADSHGLSVILESAGGRTADGGSRNPDYRKALRLLLERLRDRKAVLVRAVVDSRKLTSLPETDRTVLEGPVVLVEQPDLDRVRLRLTASQGTIGQSAEATKAGNNSKRLRLRVAVPGHEAANAAALERELANPSGAVPVPSPRMPDPITSDNHGAFTTAARQTLVLIAPCYGNSASRARFQDTLEQEVSFTEQPVVGALNRDETQRLLAAHPAGRARFWGALSRHDSKMDRLAPGDPVLFTGQNRVQAIAYLGCKLRNAALADALWQPEPDTGSWSNVYTLVDFRRVHDLRYSDLQVLAGYSPRDVFQETRVPRPEQAAALIAGLGLTATEAIEENHEHAGDRLIKALGSDQELFSAEESHTDTTTYERSAATVTVRRAEARLVAKYRATLPELMRLRLAVGWTDLYCIEDGDLIEAKRSASHSYVRDALGQLLDYAAHTTQPINRLTALFPAAPAPADIRLLHTYGIDCLYWGGGEIFIRSQAPASARARIRSFWSGGPISSR